MRQRCVWTWRPPKGMSGKEYSRRALRCPGDAIPPKFHYSPCTVAGVESRNLSKRFGDHHAVDGVDLAIREGELLVLLGPSGCGKTTLLRMIAGLERPTSGEIFIAGDRVDGDVPPRARGIAMVFQSYALYPHRTVFQNIAF